MKGERANGIGQFECGDFICVNEHGLWYIGCIPFGPSCGDGFIENYRCKDQVLIEPYWFSQYFYIQFLAIFKTYASNLHVIVKAKWQIRNCVYCC